MKRSLFSAVMLALVLAFLYVPILLVVVYGFIPNGISMSYFNAAGKFSGFTAKWYAQIFSGSSSVGPLLQSFWLSLKIAGLATLVSCVLGTTAAGTDVFALLLGLSPWATAAGFWLLMLGFLRRGGFGTNCNRA